jgi:hypothetical protein
MKEMENLRERFLRESLPRQLDQLAATLASISTTARTSTDPAMIVNLLDEARNYIEWIVPGSNAEIAAELIQMNRIIVMWYKSWETARRIPHQRTLLAAQTRNWSDKVMKFSWLA